MTITILKMGHNFRNFWSLYMRPLHVETDTHTSREQCLTLLDSALLCSLPRPNSRLSGSGFPVLTSGWNYFIQRTSVIECVAQFHLKQMHMIRPKLERIQYDGTRTSTIMGYLAQIYQIEVPSYKCIVTVVARTLS